MLVTIFILSCIVPIIPSYSLCTGGFVPRIQKDNGTDAEGYHTYQAFSGNQTYPVKYKISSNATLESISYENPPYPKINIIIREVTEGGNLTIQLPTKLLGSYNRDYYSVATGAMCAGIGYGDFPTPIESNPTFTTVSFPLMNYSGVNELMIIGGNYATQEETQTVPEFPFAIPIFIISIASLIVFYRIKIRT